MSKLTLFLSLFSMVLSVKAQQTTQKKAKIIFYDAENKSATMDKFNADLKKYVLTHLLSRRQYGEDSTVYIVKKKPREMIIADSIAEASRLAKFKALIGTMAKDFNLTDLNGKQVKLSGLKGKVVVLNFWFTGCPPCVEEIPQLNKLTSIYNKSRVKFLAITFDKSEVVRNFQKDHDFKFQLLTDAKDVIDDYGINLFPGTIIVDKSGIIRLAINSDVDLVNKIKHKIDSL